MKQFSLILFTTLIIGGSVRGQSFDENWAVWTVGYGIGTWVDVVETTLDNDKNYSNLTSSVVGPFYGKIEYGITDEVGIGINLAYVSRDWSYNEVYDDGNGGKIYYPASVSYSSFSFLLRVNRHFSDNDKLDAYWGGGLGYRSGKYQETRTNPNNYSHEEFKDLFPLGADMTVGVRFWMTPTLGIYLETGMAKSVLQFGLSGRF